MNSKDSDKNGTRTKNGTKVEDYMTYGYRHQQCIILFFCMLSGYIVRACMGVALVAMVELPEFSVLLRKSHVAETDNETNSSLLFVPSENVTQVTDRQGMFNTLMLIPPYPTFEWPKKIQDAILSSFFWGYMLLQIPSAILAHRFGSRYLLSASTLINSIICVILPWAANYGGWTCTFLCRFLQGLAQACLLPSIHTFLGRWAPLPERSRLAALINGGQPLGVVLGLPITGFIASSGMGWPGIFRVYGVFGFFFTFVIWRYMADTPAQHPKISHEERMFIEQELGAPKKHAKVPWGSILRCPGMWAIISAHIGQSWGQVILYTQVPSYMANVMGVNIKANGVLTALPFLFMWMANFFYSYISDMFINKKMFSVTNTRKISNSFGCMFAALFFVVLCYVPRNIYIVETILILTCATKIAGQLGCQVINIDMSPNFAGAMMSLSNLMANAVGSLAPITTGFILTDATNPYLWRYVFFIAAGLYFLSNLVFVMLASADKVAWNEPQEETKENVEECVPMVKVVPVKT